MSNFSKLVYCKVVTWCRHRGFRPAFVYCLRLLCIGFLSRLFNTYPWLCNCNCVVLILGSLKLLHHLLSESYLVLIYWLETECRYYYAMFHIAVILTACLQDWKSLANCCCPSLSGEKHFSTSTVTFLTCMLRVRHQPMLSLLRDGIWTSLNSTTEHNAIEVWKQLYDSHNSFTLVHKCFHQFYW